MYGKWKKSDNSSQGQRSKSNVTNSQPLLAFTIGHIPTKLHQFLISSFQDFVRQKVLVLGEWVLSGRTDTKTPLKTTPARSIINPSRSFICHKTSRPTSSYMDTDKCDWTARHTVHLQLPLVMYSKNTNEIQKDLQRAWHAGDTVTMWQVTWVTSDMRIVTMGMMVVITGL